MKRSSQLTCLSVAVLLLLSAPQTCVPKALAQYREGQLGSGTGKGSSRGTGRVPPTRWRPKPSRSSGSSRWRPTPGPSAGRSSRSDGSRGLRPRPAPRVLRVTPSTPPRPNSLPVRPPTNVLPVDPPPNTLPQPQAAFNLLPPNLLPENPLPDILDPGGVIEGIGDAFKKREPRVIDVPDEETRKRNQRRDQMKREGYSDLQIDVREQLEQGQLSAENQQLLDDLHQEESARIARELEGEYGQDVSEYQDLIDRLAAEDAEDRFLHIFGLDEYGRERTTSASNSPYESVSPELRRTSADEIANRNGTERPTSILHRLKRLYEQDLAAAGYEQTAGPSVTQPWNANHTEPEFRKVEPNTTGAAFTYQQWLDAHRSEDLTTDTANPITKPAGGFPLASGSARAGSWSGPPSGSGGTRRQRLANQASARRSGAPRYSAFRLLSDDRDGEHYNPGNWRNLDRDNGGRDAPAASGGNTSRNRSRDSADNDDDDFDASSPPARDKSRSKEQRDRDRRNLAHEIDDAADNFFGSNTQGPPVIPSPGGSGFDTPNGNSSSSSSTSPGRSDNASYGSTIGSGGSPRRRRNARDRGRRSSGGRSRPSGHNGSSGSSSSSRADERRRRGSAGPRGRSDSWQRPSGQGGARSGPKIGPTPSRNSFPGSNQRGSSNRSSRDAIRKAAESGRGADLLHGATDMVAAPKNKFEPRPTYNKHGKRMGSTTSRSAPGVASRVTGAASAITDVAGLADSVSEYEKRRAELGEDHPLTLEARRDGQIRSTATAIGAALSFGNPALGVGAKIAAEEVLHAGEREYRSTPEYRDYVRRYRQYERSRDSRSGRGNTSNRGESGLSIERPSLRDSLKGLQRPNGPRIYSQDGPGKPVPPRRSPDPTRNQ